MARFAATVLFVGALATAPAALAQSDGAPQAAEATEAAHATAAYDSEALSEDGFQPAAGTGDLDTIPGGKLMLLAYLVFFVLLTFYTTMLARRHTAVQAELAHLRRLMEDIDDRLDAANSPKA